MRIKETDRKKVILKKEGKLSAKLGDLINFTYEKELKELINVRKNNAKR